MRPESSLHGSSLRPLVALAKVRKECGGEQGAEAGAGGGHGGAGEGVESRADIGGGRQIGGGDFFDDSRKHGAGVAIAKEGVGGI